MNQPCPRCKSFQTFSNKKTAMIIFPCMGMFTGFLFLFIFFPLAPICVIGGFVLAIVAAVGNDKSWTCSACKNRWKVQN